MTEKERAEKIWKLKGQRWETALANREKIFFSLWKNHRERKNDYDEGDGGFQMAGKLSGKKNRAFYQVIELALKAGFFIKTREAIREKSTRLFRKNKPLFKKIYETDYKQFIKTTKSSDDEILQEKIKQINDFDVKELANRDAKKSLKVSKTTIEKLNYDVYKLYDLKKTMLPYYFDLMKRLNNAAISDELKFTSYLRFDTKRGCVGLPTGRPSSYLCQTLNEENEHDEDEVGEFRGEFFSRIGIPDYELVYDMKSQVPRVNFLFHTGEWRPDSYDFYREILNNTRACQVGEDLITRGKTKLTGQADSMKGIFMRIYFGRKRKEDLFRNYRYGFLKRHKDYETEIEEWPGGPITTRYDHPGNYTTIKENEWIDYYNTTQKIVGPSIHNLIWWFCFFLETEVKIELLDKGKTVYNVYDAFYFDKRYKEETKAEIIEILKDKARAVYENWMKPLQKTDVIENRLKLINQP